MQPTTPMGSRTTRLLPTVSSKAKVCTTCAAMPKLAFGRPAWMIWASFTGMPTSWATTVAISSVRASRPSWMRVRYLARSSTLVWLQPSKALRAAATARSTSAAVPSGMVAITSSVAELTTSSVPEPADGTQVPSM